jgi:hypothetical protein
LQELALLGSYTPMLTTDCGEKEELYGVTGRAHHHSYTSANEA